MDNQTNISKKHIILFFVGLSVLAFFLFLCTHSIVTVRGIGDEEKTIYLHQGREGQEKVFNLTTNSKTFILPKGTYTLEVTAGNKESIYQKKFGGLTKYTISAEAIPQKQSVALGISTFRCATTQDTGVSTIFYPCNPSHAGMLNAQINGNLDTMVDPMNIGTQDGIALDERADRLGSIMKPYKGGFIEAEVESNTLFLRERDGTGQVINNQATKIRGFNSTLSDDYFSVVDDKNSTGFAIFDSKNKNILLFKDIDDTKPKKVDLSNEEIFETEVQVEHLFLSHDYAYLTITRDPNLLETHNDMGEEDDSLTEEVDEADNNQRVIKVNIAEGAIEKTIKLPDDLTVRNINVSPRGDMVFTPHLTADNQRIVILNIDNKLQDIPFLSNDIRDICWENNDGFYYSTGDGERLYKYSLKNNVSFLAYENPVAAITSLNCTFGSVTFTLASGSDGLVDEYSFFTLDNKDMGSGSRLESVLPIYLDFPGNTTIKVVQSKSSVLVSLLYDQGEPLSKTVIQQRVIEKLKNQGVNTEKLQIEYTF
jgi:hypothetical protein